LKFISVLDDKLYLEHRDNLVTIELEYCWTTFHYKQEIEESSLY